MNWPNITLTPLKSALLFFAVALLALLNCWINAVRTDGPAPFGIALCAFNGGLFLSTGLLYFTIWRTGKSPFDTVPTQTPTPSGTPSDIKSRLDQLHQLFKDGTITQEEHTAQRGKILAEI